MWSAQHEDVDPVTEKMRIGCAGRVLCFADVIAGWRDDEHFRAFCIAELAATPFQAFFWEMPPVRQGALDRDYEYVTVRGDSLARMSADGSAFAAQLNATDDTVVCFPNLGSDALLVVPRQDGDARSYAHIGAFIRAAPDEQKHALLRALALSLDRRLDESSDPIWVSTSGLGVPWVHVRLDSFPKYYQYEAYARAGER
jgi:hypothetical protein